MIRATLTLSLLLSISACASTVVPADAGDAALHDASDIAADAALHDASDIATDAVINDLAAIPCGDVPCVAGEICIRGQCAGCCDLPPRCIPVPTGCTGAPACGCFTRDPCNCTTCSSVEADGIHCDHCMCQCAAPWTLIATPEGPRRIDTLREGELVYSVDHGTLVAVPIARVGHRAVHRHALVRLLLVSGEVVEMSGSHPTGDGRRFDMLGPGDWLGDAQIESVETEPYGEPFTYDILPDSDSGTYFAAGAWVGSTMHD